jgi:hypothetical protein
MRLTVLLKHLKSITESTTSHNFYWRNKMWHPNLGLTEQTVRNAEIYRKVVVEKVNPVEIATEHGISRSRVVDIVKHQAATRGHTTEMEEGKSYPKNFTLTQLRKDIENKVKLDPPLPKMCDMKAAVPKTKVVYTLGEVCGWSRGTAIEFSYVDVRIEDFDSRSRSTLELPTAHAIKLVKMANKLKAD